MLARKTVHSLSARNVQRRQPVKVFAANGNGEPKKVVVIGGGWAGFGAAKHLTEQGYKVGC